MKAKNEHELLEKLLKKAKTRKSHIEKASVFQTGKLIIEYHRFMEEIIDDIEHLNEISKTSLE